MSLSELLHRPDLFRQEAYINGRFIEPADNRRFPVMNPYDGSLIATVADSTAEQTREAIDAAERAFHEWKLYTGMERGRKLRKWAELQLDHLEDLAQILTLEQGKPLAEARGEIRYGASFVEWFAEEAKRVYGDTIPGHQRNKRLLVLKQPIGVTAAITPWNFPNAMITRKVAPALAAGCSVVVKPSELTPLSALALAVLAEEAGIPAGIFNVVPTSDPAMVGGILTAHPVVRKLSFTGSTEVGKLLARQCADTVKKVSLELGGNAPFIVFEDADLEKAVEGAIAAKYRNAGQTCVCANRIFVHESLKDAFLARFVPAVAEQKSGGGFEKGVTIGPLIEEKAISFVESVLEDAVAKGARILTGGKRLGDGSLFFEPTVVCDVRPDMRIHQEEIFGPVAPVSTFRTDEEVIALANHTPYGLAAYFFGKEISRCWKVAEALEYGMIGINTGLLSTEVAPFGGIKESGYGREGSKYGIEEFLQLKYLCWEV